MQIAQAPRFLSRYFTPFDGIAFIYAVVSGVSLWSSDFNWRPPFIPLAMQAVLVPVLLVATVVRFVQRRSPYARLLLAVVVLISVVMAGRILNRDKVEELVAQYGAQAIAEECLRIIQSPPNSDATTDGSSNELPVGEFPIIRAIPKRFVSWRPANMPGKSDDGRDGYFLMLVSWQASIQLLFDQESERYVLIAGYRDSSGRTELYAFPASSQPATRPVSSTSQTGDA